MQRLMSLKLESDIVQYNVQYTCHNVIQCHHRVQTHTCVPFAQSYFNVCKILGQ